MRTVKKEFINYLWSVPRQKWTGLFYTVSRCPINWFEAWEEITDESINLEVSLKLFPLEQASDGSHVLIAQTEWKGCHLLSVLTDKPYKIIDIKSGSPEYAAVVTWEECV